MTRWIWSRRSGTDPSRPSVEGSRPWLRAFDPEPDEIRSTDYFDGSQADGKPGFYVFAGFQGRAVGRNIFLDGNTLRDDGPGVDKKVLVGDIQAGLSLFWSDDLRIDFSAVRRSREFDRPAPPPT